MGLQLRCFIVFAFGCLIPNICNAQEASDALNAQNCGLSRNTYNGAKIVGGRNAVEGEYPWQLSLEMQMIPLFTDFRHICGASLINRNWAITAAHCIAGGYLTRYRVVAGGHNISTRSTPIKSIVVPLVHEGYNPVRSLRNDIAMLRISSPISMDASDGYINGVCLPPPSYANNATGMATVTGWGTTSQGGDLAGTLQSVDVPLMTDDACRKAYGDNIEETMICAGYEEGGRDSCQGDSGGPLVQRSESGVSSLIGIVSWGRGCAQPGYPGVYTETSHYIDWIARAMQQPTIIPTTENTKFIEEAYYLRGRN